MIEILHPGFFSTIQDIGRFGYVHLGVPTSGPMDRASAQRANLLLKNNPGTAIIEMTMTAVKLKFNISTKISITGAEMQPRLNERPFRQDISVSITAGDVLSFGQLAKGFRTYLAIDGGFDSEVKLGSQCMYQGITTETILKKGQRLKINLKETSSHNVILQNITDLDQVELNVFAGPEFEALTPKQKEYIFTNPFTVSKYNNRMAYQLEQILENTLSPILTSPVIPGTVQLTPSGKLIILMRDCQTTGGYPRVLQLSESAINVLAQKMAGNKVKFNLIR